MSDLQAQRVLRVEDIGVVALSDAINAVVGAAATKLERPDVAPAPTLLVVCADRGNFRLRLGDKVAEMPATEDPSAPIANGKGGLKLWEGQALVFSAPKAITVKGYAADSVLSYYWV